MVFLPAGESFFKWTHKKMPTPMDLGIADAFCDTYGHDCTLISGSKVYYTVSGDRDVMDAIHEDVQRWIYIQERSWPVRQDSKGFYFDMDSSSSSCCVVS